MALKRYPELEKVVEQTEGQSPAISQEAAMEKMVRAAITTQEIQAMAEQLRKLAQEIEQTAPKAGQKTAKEAWIADDIELIAKQALIS